jgi:hypothetical protein
VDTEFWEGLAMDDWNNKFRKMQADMNGAAKKAAEAEEAKARGDGERLARKQQVLMTIVLPRLEHIAAKAGEYGIPARADPATESRAQRFGPPMHTVGGALLMAGHPGHRNGEAQLSIRGWGAADHFEVVLPRGALGPENLRRYPIEAMTSELVDQLAEELFEVWSARAK